MTTNDQLMEQFRREAPYTLQREVDGYCDTRMAERHKFTVI